MRLLVIAMYHLKCLSNTIQLKRIHDSKRATSSMMLETPPDNLPLGRALMQIVRYTPTPTYLQSSLGHIDFRVTRERYTHRSNRKSSVSTRPSLRP